MSKISAKNLHYSTALPPFLARLRGEHASPRDGPDPMLAGRRRPTKPRSGSAEAEDAPMVVDERGEVVGGWAVQGDGSLAEVAETKAAVGEEEGAAEKGEEGRRETEEAGKEGKEGEKVVVGVGGNRKRKVGRVIGGDEDEADSRAEAVTKGDDKEKSAPAKTKGSKKKAKKVKLSFGDDEG
ncbi:hypothetical protein B0H67DRAFT_603603 [Lasiosphaeris hirsuta]|uniref:DUF4604 domain-containing protein n=1 Tax=Lasiosphaeris hirsuta TaxID=260670 RepID=A0AA39ZVE6_9PEZI|nr:hypothetical protein B0H67DRAFT_603603 [Lasiosphaeris hirsuta]